MRAAITILALAALLALAVCSGDGYRHIDHREHIE